MGPDAEEAVPALAETLSDNDPGVRCKAAWALGRIGPGAAPAVGELAEVLWKPSVSPLLLVETVKALGNVGPAATSTVRDLCLLLKVANKSVQKAVIQALQKIVPDHDFKESAPAQSE